MSTTISNTDLIREFLALPPEAMPSAEWCDERVREGGVSFYGTFFPADIDDDPMDLPSAWSALKRVVRDGDWSGQRIGVRIKSNSRGIDAIVYV